MSQCSSFFLFVQLPIIQSYSAKGLCNSWTGGDVSSSSFYQGVDISINDLFIGGFSYNSDAPLTGISSDGHSGIYLDSVSNFVFSLGTISLPSASLPATIFGGGLIVDNDGLFGWDNFFVTHGFASPEWFATIDFNLMDHDGAVFDDFSIPTSLNLSDFETLYFTMGFVREQDGDQLHLYGHFSNVTFSPEPVPEPSSLTLLGIGLVGLLGYGCIAGDSVLGKSGEGCPICLPRHSQEFAGSAAG